MKPRIFLGSSAQQEKLLQALTRGLRDIADVDKWTTGARAQPARLGLNQTARTDSDGGGG
jgi:hypothetical protein